MHNQDHPERLCSKCRARIPAKNQEVVVKTRWLPVIVKDGVMVNDGRRGPK